MSRWALRPMSALLLTAAAVVFGLFLVAAVVLRLADASDDVTAWVAGGLAYLFLAYTVVIVLTERRRARNRSRLAVAEYLKGESGVVVRVGSPVSVQMEPDVAAPPGAKEWTAPATIAGPQGSVAVTASLERRHGVWHGMRWDVA